MCTRMLILVKTKYKSLAYVYKRQNIMNVNYNFKYYNYFDNIYVILCYQKIYIFLELKKVYAATIFHDYSYRWI